MYFLMFLFFVRFLPFTQPSPIPDQAYDENGDLCLSRREVSGIFDYSETAPEDSVFGHYEASGRSQDSDLSNEGLDGDLGFFSDDVAALPLDGAPEDPSGRRKGACPANSNSSPSGFEIFSPIPANPYIPSCELGYPFTLCCYGIPVPVPRGSAILGSGGLALPDLNEADGEVHVGECITCNFSHCAFLHVMPAYVWIQTALRR